MLLHSPPLHNLLLHNLRRLKKHYLIKFILILIEVGKSKLNSACNGGLYIVYQMEGAHMSFGPVM